MAKREKKLRIPNWGIYCLGGIGVLIVLVLLYVVFFQPKEEHKEKGITYENFLKLNIGMTKEEVFRILGEDSCIVAGFQTEEGKSSTSYSCVNSDGSNIQLVLVDDLLADKSEFGFTE